jgi:ATP-binding cassette subfamily B protein
MRIIFVNLLIIWNNFSRKNKIRFVFLFLSIFFSVFLDILSLGAVFPFILLIVSPDNFFNVKLIKIFLDFFLIKDLYIFSNIIFFSFVILVVIAGIFKTYTLYLISKFNSDVGKELSVQIYQKLIYLNYKDYLGLTTNKIISDLSYKVGDVIFSIISPIILMLSSMLLVISITILFLFLNFIILITLLTFFLLSYLLIIFYVKKKLIYSSAIISKEDENCIKLIQEGLGSKKDLLLYNMHEVYIKKFNLSVEKLRIAQSNINFISTTPRHVVETIAIVIFSLLSFYLIKTHNNFNLALPYFGVFALGAQKLLPALQQIYNSFSRVVGSREALDSVTKILCFQQKNNNQISLESLSFKKEIRARDLTFNYLNGLTAIKSLNFTIRNGQKIGFIGKSGSGKSTLLDILMGFLMPNNGSIEIDEKKINEKNVSQWMRNIAYVPQNIFLINDTIKNNIVFDLHNQIIDEDLLDRSITLSDLHNFIKSQPQGINTNIGEKGINLSGGERQRLAIARALYKNKNVIFFDEATSSLDYHTEDNILHLIKKINDKTLIFISHRLNSLNFCDKLFLMEEGKIIDNGTYEYLSKKYSF